MERVCQKNIKTFGSTASAEIVSYAYPMDLWCVFITTDWSWFQRIFAGNKSDWEKNFRILGKVRNPIAHSNADFVLEEEHRMAKAICSKICKKIEEWHEKYL